MNNIMAPEAGEIYEKGGRAGGQRSDQRSDQRMKTKRTIGGKKTEERHTEGAAAAEAAEEEEEAVVVGSPWWVVVEGGVTTMVFGSARSRLIAASSELWAPYATKGERRRALGSKEREREREWRVESGEGGRDVREREKGTA